MSHPSDSIDGYSSFLSHYGLKLENIKSVPMQLLGSHYCYFSGNHFASHACRHASVPPVSHRALSPYYALRIHEVHAEKILVDAGMHFEVLSKMGSSGCFH